MFDSELLKSPPFWTIVGVLTGFLLGEGSRYIRYRLRISRLKKLIKDELRSILFQISQKKDIVQQIIAKLKSHAILSGVSVAIINTGYRQHIAELYEHLTVLQRNSLPVIHERLEVADRVLDSLEHDLPSALREKIINDPFKAYQGRMEDIFESYGAVEDLIRKYLNGKPIDVFSVEGSK